MSKQIYILNGKSNDSGVIKIVSGTKRTILSINLPSSSQNKKICQIESGNDIIEIGSFYKKRTDFDIPKGLIVDKIIITENGEQIFWTGESSQNSKIAQEPETVSENVTFDNFLGGGFDWQRIRGNFILYDYSIIHHILSFKSVYKAINQAGYYCAGICEKDNVKIIAVAIPLIKSISNPFSEITNDVYKIKNGKTYYDVLCVGIDKTGEFFISY